MKKHRINNGDKPMESCEKIKNRISQATDEVLVKRKIVPGKSWVISINRRAE